MIVLFFKNIFRLQIITENTWKILKLEWATPGFFFFQKSGNPVYVICYGLAQTAHLCSRLANSVARMLTTSSFQ